MLGKKVLITGANGLVGNYMVDKCLAKGAIVTAVDIVEPTNQLERYGDKYYRFIKADLREFSNCKKVVEGQDIIFHIAGVKGYQKEQWNNQPIILYQCCSLIPI